MISEESDIHLYNLTLQRNSNYVHSCIGHFIDRRPVHSQNTDDDNSKKKRKKKQKELQICLATETHIELCDMENGTINKICSFPIFATIRSMGKLSLESSYSHLVLVSDSGNLTIGRFVRHESQAYAIKFQTLFNEPFSRSGIRRLSPQAHLEIDLHGRCILLSAMERNKLCYLTESKNDQLQISSPLEANRANFVTMQTAVCDVGFDNPCFASLEIDTVDKSRHLVFYILDLGLNHIIKKTEFTLSGDLNFIIPVPNLESYNIRTRNSPIQNRSAKEEEEEEGGGDDAADDEINPFVILGFDDYISLRDLRGFYNLKVKIPKRKGSTSTYIITGTLHKLKKEFFILLQSNHGDLYKVRVLGNDEDNNNPLLTITYFDTLPLAESLHILKNGFMFANMETGNNVLYQFESLGNDDDFATINTSQEPERDLILKVNDTLENLSIADQQSNLNPILSNQIVETTPLTMLTQTKSNTGIVTTGVGFETLISSPLPSSPDGIWTIRFPQDQEHKLLFLSFPKSTMILKIADGTVEELDTEENPFQMKNDKTIFTGSMGNKSIIQVCENGMVQVTMERFLDAEGNERLKFTTKLNWYPPAGIKIVKATCTTTQLVVALSNNEIAYFETDNTNGTDSLNEFQDRIEIDDKITAISLSQGHRSDFLIIATRDSSVKLLSLRKSDQENFLETISMQALVSPANSVLLVETAEALHLHVGLVDGVYVRSKVARHDGQLLDVRTKYLGSKPVDISIIPDVDPRIDEREEDNDEDEEDELEEEMKKSKIPAVILHCNKTWISYELDSLMFIRPLLLSGIQGLKKASGFVTDEMRFNGCCSVSSSGALVIGKIKNLNTKEQWFQRRDIQTKDVKRGGDDADRNEDDSSDGDNDDDDDDDDNDDDGTKKEHGVSANNFIGKKIVQDFEDKKLFYVVENSLENDSCRISVTKSHQSYRNDYTRDHYQVLEQCRCLHAAITRFGQSDKYFIISTDTGTLKTFKLRITKTNGTRSFSLDFINVTDIGDKVYSMTSFGDKLLVPVNNALVLYGLGKKQLLKKSITMTPPSITKITALVQWDNERIATGDIQESVTFFQFDKSSNRFFALADDIVKRHVTTLQFLDRSTVIGGDKFGNCWVLRIPQEHERFITEEFSFFMSRYHKPPSGTLNPNIMECPFKLNLMNHFYLNDIPMSFHLVEMVQMSDRAAILYTGLQGTIGCLLPLVTKKEVDFFQSLEKVLQDADDLFFLERENRLASNKDDEEGELLGEGFTDNSKSKTHDKDPIPEGAYSIVGRDHLIYRSYYSPVKNIIDGDLCENFFRLYPSEQKYLSDKMGRRNVSDITRRVNEIRTNYL